MRDLLNGLQIRDTERVEDLEIVFDRLGECFQDTQYLDLIEVLIDKLPNLLRNALSSKYIEPFIIFDYSIKSAQTKDSYFRRLRTFFQYYLIEGGNFRDKCNSFAIRGKKNPHWVFKVIQSLVPGLFFTDNFV